MKTTSKRKLGHKILISCILFAIILSAFIGTVGYQTYKSNILERYQIYAGTLLKIADSYFDKEDLETCIKTGTESNLYLTAREGLDIIKSRADVSYIYSIYFPDKDDKTKLCYVMNGTTEEQREEEGDQAISHLGELCGKTDFDPAMTDKFWDSMYGVESQSTAQRTDPDHSFYYIVNDTKEYGYQMTGYQVIRNADNDALCILALDISMNSIKTNIRSYLFTVVAATAVILALFLFLFIAIMNRAVINPVKALTESASDFVKQTYTVESPSLLEYKKVDLHTKDEMEILSNSLSNMTDEIKSYMENLQKITAEKERIGSELSVATEIQASLLPSIFPPFPEREEFSIYAMMNPAKEVGGDFYDFFLTDENHLAIVIADVSGKGVPAALFMVISKTLIKNQLQAGTELSEAIQLVNSQLCENNDAEMFVTAWIGILEISSSKLEYVSAGHNPPLIKTQNTENKFSYLRSKPSLVLAFMKGVHYRKYELQLFSGDMIYLYTDGVTEAINAQEELFGEDRLLETANRHLADAPAQLLPLIRQEVGQFSIEMEQFDDITMLGLKLK